ncbi:MAG: sporulation protein YqfC [Chitinophagales bacterium]
MADKKDNKKMDWLLANVLELPRDLVMDSSRLTMIGQNEMFLENHKGIIEYRSELIKINLARGFIEIEGEGMEIVSITGTELTLVGRIFGLRFIQ